MKLARIARFSPLLVLFAGACSKTPQRVELKPVTLELTKRGESKQVEATVMDKYGEKLSNPVTWSSAAPKVASVDGTGKVTAVASGSAVIRAQAGEVSSQITVSVSIPASIEIAPSALLLREIGATETLTTVVKDDAGQSVLGAAIEWTSDNPAVATVSEGNVTAVAEGNAQIKAQSGEASAVAQVVVRGPQPTTITIDRPIAVVKTGSTEGVSASVADESGAPMTAPISWSSADPSIATVDMSGVITGVRRGETVITASAGQASASLQVKVR